jgi:hypothetical protein
MATYTTNFNKPRLQSKGWILDLGQVHESAEVTLNGRSLGTLIGPVFQLYLDDDALKNENILEVWVCNSMMNRIADLDRRHVFWKKFYNVNFPARKAENRRNGLFDASAWEVKESGMEGPVELIPAGP